MIALWNRWRRRTGLVVATDGATIARPVTVEEVESQPLAPVPLTPVEQLREQIAGYIAAHDVPAATEAYFKLLALDPHQVLARRGQLEIANYLAQSQQYEAGAAAYEAYLAAYPGSVDVAQVHLFLGLIYSRYLHAYAQAVGHLRQALTQLQHDTQRTLAEDELQVAEARLAQS
jgi:outer membrane protein assembly factor BamD (BamD/ComL family)